MTRYMLLLLVSMPCQALTVCLSFDNRSMSKTYTSQSDCAAKLHGDIVRDGGGGAKRYIRDITQICATAASRGSNPCSVPDNVCRHPVTHAQVTGITNCSLKALIPYLGLQADYPQ